MMLHGRGPQHPDMKKAQQRLDFFRVLKQKQPVLPLLLHQHHRNHHQVPTTLPGGHLEPPLPDKKHQQNHELAPDNTNTNIFIYSCACIFSEDILIHLYSSFSLPFIVLCSKTINSSENQLIDYIRIFCNKVLCKNLKAPSFLYIC